jgi:hypothetical protein
MSEVESEIRRKHNQLSADLAARIREFQEETGCAVLRIAVQNGGDKAGIPRLIGVAVEIEVDALDEQRAVESE